MAEIAMRACLASHGEILDVITSAFYDIYSSAILIDSMPPQSVEKCMHFGRRDQLCENTYSEVTCLITKTLGSHKCMLSFKQSSWKSSYMPALSHANVVCLDERNHAFKLGSSGIQQVMIAGHHTTSVSVICDKRNKP